MRTATLQKSTIILPLDEAVAATRAALKGKRFPLEDEKRLQREILAALHAANLWPEREARLDEASTIDFLFPCGLGLEVKIKGGAAAIARQIERYAAHERIAAVAVLTSKPLALPHRTANGKRLYVVNLAEGWL